MFIFKKNDNNIYENRYPVHAAIIRGEKNFIDLIDQNPDQVNKLDTMKKTPLFVAIQHRQYGIVKHLLDRHADVNIKDITNKVPLHFAIEDSHHESKTSMIKLLVEHGADLNVCNSKGDMPLHLLARQSADDHFDFDLFKWLIKKGAKPNVENKQGKTAIQLFEQYHAQQFSAVYRAYKHFGKETFAVENPKMAKAVLLGPTATVLVAGGAAAVVLTTGFAVIPIAITGHILSSSVSGGVGLGSAAFFATKKSHTSIESQIRELNDIHTEGYSSDEEEVALCHHISDGRCNHI